jgi:tetratricopeptide (TPR) repeat protein
MGADYTIAPWTMSLPKHLMALLSRRRLPVACVAAAGLVLAAYSSSLDNAFHFDDQHVIEENAYIRDLRNAPRFFTDARTFSSLPANVTYRPVLTLTLAVDYALVRGLYPRQFHVTQLVLLLGLGALLFAVGRRLVGPWEGLFGATLFCVHTANSQVGNYISARSEILSAMGLMGGLLLYLRGSRRGLYLVPMALGALAKAPAVMLAPILLSYELLVARSPLKVALRRTAPAFVAAAACYALVEWMNPPGQNYGGGARLPYLWTQAWVWVRYLRLFVLPTGLTADSDLGVLPSPVDWRVLVGVIVILGLGAAIWRAARRPELGVVAFGLAWFALALAPTSSIIPLAEVTNDHRPFLGYLGLTLAVVALAASALKEQRTVAVLGAGLLLGAHAVGTFHRSFVWRDTVSLWADAVEKGPANGRAWTNYGQALMSRARYPEAKHALEKAVALAPYYAVPEINLGVLNDALGDPAAAERHFQRALELAPQYGAAHRYYASWLIRQGRGPQAIQHLQRVIVSSPGDLPAQNELKALLIAQGQLQPEPISAGDVPGLLQKAAALASQNQHMGAAKAYRQVLLLLPEHPEARTGLARSLWQLGFQGSP